MRALTFLGGRRRLVLAALLAAAPAAALAQQQGEPSAPQAEAKGHVEKLDWSFAGVFGHYDQAQLQRGFKVFQEVCSACHSMSLVPFRTLASPNGPDFPEAAVAQIAKDWPVKVTAISNEDGQPFDRDATPADTIPPPFPNKAAAAAANGGAAPPDFSLIAKARAAHRGFPGFVTDAFAGYQEAGPDYIHALLLGYKDPPEGTPEVAGKYYNPTFIAANWIAMPPPLASDGQIEYTDGTPTTIDQYARDVAAFLMWASEPHLDTRKELGFRVIIFLAVFAVLLWLTKQRLWRNVEH